MAHTDKTLKCRDCGNDFTWSAEEQDFYAEKGFTEPLRCKECRMKAKANRDRNGGNRHGGPKQSFPIVCAQCGAEDTVPFQPKGDRPVLCRNCFRSGDNK